jgi:small-conductance mechanosensitive channel/CRP-like cAMP-binding protein
LFGLLLLGLYQPWLWDPFTGEEAPESPLAVRRLFQTCLWLAGASLVHRSLCAFLLDGALRRALGRPVPKLFSDVLGLTIYLVAGVFIANKVFGVALTGFWAMSGVLGIVLGLALRPIILDFFSGLGANLERAFVIGDWISIENAEGRHSGWIDQINWRTIRIRTRDGNVLILPNSRLATSVITNYRMPDPVSRFGLRLKLELEAPTERVLRILNSAVSAACSDPLGPRKHPPPSVRVAEASESGVEYWVRFWCNPAEESQDDVIHTVLVYVLDHLGKAGLSFAHPQENVFLSRLPRAATGFKGVEERVQFLRKVDLFDAFSDENLRYLAGELRLRTVPRGSCLVRAGEEGDSMFLLAEGVLSVRRDDPRDGDVVELALLNPGQFFGEGSLLTGEPRSASVMAATECVLFEIEKASLEPLLSRHPELLESLSNTMAARRDANASRTSAAQGADAPMATGRTQILLNRMRQFFRLGNSESKDSPRNIQQAG